MPQSPPEDANPPAEPQFEQIEPVGQIETDRFCDDCGYNLHQQTVRRDPRTKILLARCPECGRYACATDLTTAGRIWLRRLSTLLLLFWLMFLMATAFGGPTMQAVNTLDNLERLDDLDYRFMQMARNENYSNKERFALLRNQFKNYAEMCIDSSMVASIHGFLNIFFLSVMLTHWRRWRFLWWMITAVILSTIGLYAWLFFRGELRVAEGQIWFIALHGFAFCIGAVIATVVSRPLARLVVRLLLPRKLRGPLSFLWHADGLAPPA